MPKRLLNTNFIEELQREAILKNPYLKELVREVMLTTRAVNILAKRYVAIGAAIKRIRYLDQQTASKTGNDLVFRMKKKRKDAGKKRGKRSKAKLPNNVIPFEAGRKKSA